jgi:putative component of toxin-antitoxin plasmid stabilization module
MAGIREGFYKTMTAEEEHAAFQEFEERLVNSMNSSTLEVPGAGKLLGASNSVVRKMAGNTTIKKVAGGLISRIKESPKLVRAAEASSSVQRSLDNLTEQLAKGNMNPGIGTKFIGKGIFEARARDGARVYFRQMGDGTIEVLGKSTKDNQQSVIDEVLRVFGR